MQEIFLSLKFAWKNLTANFGRTMLTLSGIIIGTIVIIMVVTLGDVVKGYVLGQVDTYGSDVIQVEVKIPSASKNSTQNATSLASGVQITTLKQSDAEEIEKLPNVVTWYGGSLGQELVSFQEINKRIMLFGASSGIVGVDKNIKLAEGSFYSESQEKGLSQVVVLGSGVKESLFGDTPAIGKNIKMKGQSYKVIGVLEERGSTGFVSFDDFIYVPLQTLQKKILGVDHVTFITVKMRDVSMAAQTARDIEILLRDRHDIRKEGQDDFAVTTIKEAQEMIQTVFGAIQMLLLVLASISLIVGGVGIMNVMFVAVAERTGEIGLRKALGARAKDILWQFLVEALIVALIGGIIGIIIAEVLLFGIFALLPSFGFPVAFDFSLQTVLLAMAFSMIAGLTFGVYPAWRASQISPIQAIRQG
ncbi:MAG: ABC transporter permease [Candidatus Moranbacteria bacterium]|nr:ABC transporter permease [Candidatus Moranbacteria bacterium]